MNNMGNIKKRLIFYFHTFEGFLDNRAIQIHLRCLAYYCNVFDEALFIISVDDTKNDRLIYDTETALLKCGFRNVQFKVHRNNPYCEAQPFFEEIVEKMNSLDGLTFFGHTKGEGNYNRKDANSEAVDAWILGLYYTNLSYLEEVENRLIKDFSCLFGAQRL